MGRTSLDLPGPAGYISFHTAQDTFGFLFYKCTFLDQVELSINTPKAFSSGLPSVHPTHRSYFVSIPSSHTPTIISQLEAERCCHGDFWASCPTGKTFLPWLLQQSTHTDNFTCKTGLISLLKTLEFQILYRPHISKYLLRPASTIIITALMGCYRTRGSTLDSTDQLQLVSPPFPLFLCDWG